MLPTLHVRPAGLRQWRDLDRAFDEFFLRPTRVTTWAPDADFYETDDEYVLEMETPGFDAERIDVTVEKGILSVHGETEGVEESGDRSYHVRERSSRRFTRSFALPHSVASEGVIAELEEGLLSVRLPKAAESKPRKIGVSTK